MSWVDVLITIIMTLYESVFFFSPASLSSLKTELERVKAEKEQVHEL
jgi:hypothetical protein